MTNAEIIKKAKKYAAEEKQRGDDFGRGAYFGARFVIELLEKAEKTQLKKLIAFEVKSFKPADLLEELGADYMLVMKAVCNGDARLILKEEKK